MKQNGTGILNLAGKKRTDLAHGREGFRNDILLTLKSVPERHVRVLIVTSELDVNNITTRMAGHAKRKRYVYILSILTGFRKSDNCYLPLTLYLSLFREPSNLLENQTRW